MAVTFTLKISLNWKVIMGVRANWDQFAVQSGRPGNGKKNLTIVRLTGIYSSRINKKTTNSSLLSISNLRILNINYSIFTKRKLSLTKKPLDI